MRRIAGIRTSNHLAVGLVLVVFGIGATFAHAKPLEHFSDTFQGSFIRHGFCGDMEVRIDVSQDFAVLGRESGPDGFSRYTVTFHGSETYTNLATGKVVTNHFDYLSQDVVLTDNGDGTITILYKTPGAGRYFGPTGKVVLIDSRPQWWEALIDLGDPSDPTDDTFISEKLVNDVAAHVNEDFCTAIRTATG